MTISGVDLRVGKNIEYNNSICTVVEFSHIKPGKGPAFVRVRLKSWETSAITEHTFRPEDKFTLVEIYEKPYQYLYTAGDEYWFMEKETYEQVALRKDVIKDNDKYLVENIDVLLLDYNGNIVGIKMPVVVEQRIKETEPGFKGDTATGGTKPAITETGLSIQVPLFVEVDDIVRIDTRTGGYVERAKR
ncbi:TPA: elongation factor P [bacterium]|nr:elongation factor P [bacterium]